MKIVLLGPPLAGKGTQAQLLSKEFAIPRLSVGEHLRDLYSNSDPSGIEAASFMKKGQAVPGKLLMELMIPWLISQRKGFVIDRFIMSHDQLNEYDRVAKIHNFKLDYVIHIRVGIPTLEQRFGLRKNAQVRFDDTIKLLPYRIKVFNESIEAIKDYFTEKNVYHEVNGEQEISKVNTDIKQIILEK